MILDLFAGMGGWSEGLAAHGRADIGIEMDKPACRTRVAAGHRTICADVTKMSWAPLIGEVEGIIASPPCTDWSQSGKRQGLNGATGALVLEVDRWVRVLHPRWVACEQVPPAVEWWHRLAREWQELGYTTWAGLLNAADYGVPQTRTRAFLLASLDRQPVPPAPTHDRSPEPPLFGDELAPWISMASALGWGSREGSKAGEGGVEPYERSVNRPAPTLDTNIGAKWRVLQTNRGQDEYGNGQEVALTAPAPALSTKAGGQWVFDRPATTLAGDSRVADPGYRCRPGENRFRPDGIRLSIEDALTLQSFRADYPVQGTNTKQFEQVGNAVPPLLAFHVLSAVL